MKKLLALGALLAATSFPVAQALHIEALTGSCGTRTDGYAIRSYFGEIDLDVYSAQHTFSGLTRQSHARLTQRDDLFIMYWAVLRAGTADMINFQVGDRSCTTRGMGFSQDTTVYVFGP